MNEPLILGLDIGTSSVRAALFDVVGKIRPLSFVKLKHSFTNTYSGGSEFGADELISRVVSAIDSVLSKHGQGEIEAVAISCFWHSLMGVDYRGKPTTPVLGWADRRSRQYSDVLKQRFDEPSVHDRTGAHFHSSFWPAKVLWLKAEFPNIYKRTAMWVSFADYLLSQLIDPKAMPFFQFSEWIGDSHMTGTREAYKPDPLPMFTSISMASATGLFDIHRNSWDEPMIGALGLSHGNLSQVVWGKGHSFEFRRKYKRRWRALQNAEIFPAIGDGAADNIGSGCTTKERTALMVGTSGAMRVAYQGEPPKQIPDGLWCYRIDSRRVIVGGALSDGGNLYELLRATLTIPNDAEEKMQQRGAAAHGITVMPFFFGERSTGYREDARGAILGLNASHDTIDIEQAAMESVAYRFAAIHDRLESIGKIKHIVASGGALRCSPIWTQIIADVLGRDLLVNSTAEASMRGAVLLALESLGKIDSIDSFSVPTVSSLAFHPECHAAYRKARKQHEEFYESAKY